MCVMDKQLKKKNGHLTFQFRKGLPTPCADVKSRKSAIQLDAEPIGRRAHSTTRATFPTGHTGFRESQSTRTDR